MQNITHCTINVVDFRGDSNRHIRGNHCLFLYISLDFFNWHQWDIILEIFNSKKKVLDEITDNITLI